MKKQKRFLFCLLLMICLLPLGGLAAPAPLPDSLFGTALLDAQQRVYSMAVVKDTVYIRTDRAFYAWQEGEQQARHLADAAHATNDPKDDFPAADILLVQDGRLMGLHSGRGILYNLAFEGDQVIYEQVLQLDWAPLLQGDAPDMYYATPDWAVIQQNRLYCRFQNLENGKELYSFDLTTGRGTAHGAHALHRFVPYQDGLLLAIAFDSEKMDPATGQFLPAQLHAFDPATDAASPLDLALPALREGAWPLSQNLYWDANQNQLYVLSDGQLLRLQPQGVPTLCARLPVGDMWGGNLKSPGILPWREDLLLIATENNVFLRSMDESKLPPVTTLTGSGQLYDSNTLTRTLQQLGDIQYQPTPGGHMDAQAINTRFLTGDMTLDLLVLDSADSDIERLAAKGFLLDLSQNAELAAMADDLLPSLHKLVHHEEGLYAIPLEIRVFFPTANKLWFEELGRPLPATMQDLVDLVRWWAEEGHKNEDYQLFEMQDAKSQLKDIALSSYVNGLLGQGLPLQFDMERFGAMIQQIDGLDTSTFDNFEMGADDQDWLNMGKKAMLTYGMGYGLQDAGSTYTQPLNLSFDATMPAWQDAGATLLAIPATVPHPEEALRFLSAYVRNMDAMTRAALSDSWTEPIPNPQFEQQQRDLQLRLAQLPARIEQAQGAEKRALEQDLAYFRNEMEHLESNRYTASAQALQDYRQVMAGVYLDNSTTRVQRDSLTKDGSLFQTMLEGAITLEQFVQQANDKVRLMTLEAQ